MALDETPMDLNQNIKDLATHERKASQNGNLLTFKESSETWISPLTKIRQILLNLIGNAINSPNRLLSPFIEH